MMKGKILMQKTVFLFGLLCFFAAPAWAKLTVDPVFSSNMVLQQGKPVAFFGTAGPGETVSVEFAGRKNDVRADEGGRWKAHFPAMKADHVNYTVRIISGQEKIELRDILLGEVWFCSGQSNMALRIGKTFQRGSTAWNCTEEVANARYPEIRYALQRNVSGYLRKCPASYGWEANGGWVKCSPQTAHYFSAVSYFFGRQLHLDLKVPVGLINASVGGTRIEAWISQDGYRMASLDREIQEYQAHAFTPAEQKAYEAKKAAEYEAEMEKYLPLFEKAGAEARRQASGWEKPDLDDSQWHKAAPVRVRGQVIWSRVRFSLPASVPDTGLRLSIRKPADGGELYLNGKRIAGFSASAPENRKALCLTLQNCDLDLKGENVLAFRGQYFYDRLSEEDFRNLLQRSILMLGKNRIPLAGWKAKTEFVARLGKNGIPPPPAFLNIDYRTPQYPSTLYNGMVDAWTRLPVRGILWYQGCTNNGQSRYYLLQKALIADWRARWGEPELPFIITQLAGFGWWGPEGGWKNCNANQTGGYPLTRDIQFQVAGEVPHTGIACLIDIGEPRNIHPANKQEAGRRLALVAGRLVYGGKTVSQGPVFRKAVPDGNALRVFFDNVPTGLKTKDGKAPGAFAIAGKDGNFVWANAEISGKDSVLVFSDQVPHPEFVRYAYAAYRGDCNLMNNEELPAFPFRSDAIDYARLK